MIFIKKKFFLYDIVSSMFIDACYYKKIILQVGCEKLRHFIQQGNNSKVSVFKIDDCHHHLVR